MMIERLKGGRFSPPIKNSSHKFSDQPGNTLIGPPMNPQGEPTTSGCLIEIDLDRFRPYRQGTFHKAGRRIDLPGGPDGNDN